MKRITDIIKEDFKLKSKGHITTVNHPNKTEYKFFPESGLQFHDAVQSLIDQYGVGTKEKPLDLNSISIETMPWARNLLNGEYGLDVEYIDVSGWNLTGKDHIFGMFRGQKKLKGIYGLEFWDVADCDQFDHMFTNCISLETVDGIENWDIKQSASVEEMFKGCVKLNLNNNLDNFKKAKYKARMFMGCPIQSVPDWHMKAYKQYMHIQ